jgi:hypothetical protein
MWKWMTNWRAVAREPAIVPPVVRERRSSAVSGKYSSLHKYLQNRYADVTVLTFGQIEDLLGFTLPQLARTYHAWWTLGETNVEGPRLSDAWTLAGRTATPNLLAKTVIFERTSTARPGLQ